MLRFLTAGESHGKGLIAILEGMVANLPLLPEDINSELKRRQRGYGRGERMKIEADEVEIISGVRGGKTTGSPIGMLIRNKDWENWKEVMKIEGECKGGERYIPRPGHADFPGYLKYNLSDIRDVMERASARNTASQVAVGAICKKFLNEFGIKIYSRVIQIGEIKDTSDYREVFKNYEKIESSDVRALYKEKEMKRVIDRAKESGDTVGGIFEIIITGLCPGLGSYIQWDKRLDGKLSFILMSIPGVKGVEVGAGFSAKSFYGSEFHDEFFIENGKVKRRSNNAGGIEGGITNGNDIWIKCMMKPISTLKKGLNSFDVRDKREVKSEYERSDVCAVVPASIIGENVSAFIIADAFLEKFGGDSLEETKRNYREYLRNIEKYF
ncbi:MAG: chorismate synthase [Candidatus Omnitrophota bacterium]|nr:MAG: chorismate synthase [Candidatus Omnitrophota bacterium]